MAQSPTAPAVRRRGVLAVLATGVSAGAGGCMRRVRTIAGWQSTSQVSLQIKTLPADADPYALRIARTVAGWFQAAGIDAQVVPVAQGELHRQVLLNDEFDLFVTRGEDRFQDPDALYSLLHSQFSEAPGWQNPFGYTDMEADELLETQRRTGGDRRREAIAELQRTVARTQPFTVAAFPDDIRATRDSYYTNWLAADLHSPIGYLTLDRATGSDADGSDVESGRERRREALRMATTDPRATENLNPLSVEYRRSGILTGLLYDSLGVTTRTGRVVPWLAEAWSFSTSRGNPRATVRLRPDLEWHDGEPLAAEDVAFTYDLLADTSLGSGEETDDEKGTETRIPAPRFRGRSALVDDVVARGPRTVEFRFVGCTPTVATRAFTVPVLPEHVWTDRTRTASVGGIEFGPATEALVTENIPPVGSGPLRFVRNTPRETLVLERFEGHFLVREDVTDPPYGVADGPAFDRLGVRVVGSDATAVDLVADGEADVTGTPVGAGTVPRIGRTADLDLLVSRSGAPYVIGYNARRPPLTNPRFRNTLAQLIDQDHLTGAVFDGYARPAVSLLAGTDWLPSDLRWDGTNPVTPFLGADGELNVDAARNAFVEIGYRYDDGALVEAD